MNDDDEEEENEATGEKVDVNEMKESLDALNVSSKLKKNNIYFYLKSKKMFSE